MPSGKKPTSNMLLAPLEPEPLPPTGGAVSVPLPPPGDPSLLPPLPVEYATRLQNSPFADLPVSTIILNLAASRSYAVVLPDA